MCADTRQVEGRQKRRRRQLVAVAVAVGGARLVGTRTLVDGRVVANSRPSWLSTAGSRRGTYVLSARSRLVVAAGRREKWQTGANETRSKRLPPAGGAVVVMVAGAA